MPNINKHSSTKVGMLLAQTSSRIDLLVVHSFLPSIRLLNIQSLPFHSILWLFSASRWQFRKARPAWRLYYRYNQWQLTLSDMCRPGYRLADLRQITGISANISGRLWFAYYTELAIYSPHHSNTCGISAAGRHFQAGGITKGWASHVRYIGTWKPAKLNRRQLLRDKGCEATCRYVPAPLSLGLLSLYGGCCHPIQNALRYAWWDTKLVAICLNLRQLGTHAVTLNPIRNTKKKGKPHWDTLGLKCATSLNC